MRFYRGKTTLRQLAERVRPESGWKKRQREVLLSAIRRSDVWRSAAEPIKPGGWLQSYRILYSGTGISVLIAVVFFAGFIGTVSAARSSLPGDAFYPVKISLERAQVGLAFSQEKKAELEVAFAGSRLKEVNDLIAREGASPAATAHISQAMNHFNAGLSAVQKRLAQNQAAVSISALVNDTTSALEDDLLNIKSKISSAPSADSASIDQALKTVEETNTNSLAVIVEQAMASSDNEAKQEALAKLQTKIQRIEKNVASLLLDNNPSASTSQETLQQIVKDDSKKPEEAQKSLEEAKKILETNDPSKLNDVLSIIKDANY